MLISAAGIGINASRGQLISVDVVMNGQRIWSFEPTKDGQGTYKWPPALQSRLYGIADVEVRDSATSLTLARSRIAFDDSAQVFRFIDAAGRPLMLNKWLRPKPMLSDGHTIDLRDDLVHVLSKITETLSEIGYEVFVVGGTALGPFRDGDLLAHDDDADVAILLPDGHPSAVALSMMRLSRELQQHGYWVRVHSFAHLQVYPLAAGQRLEESLYVDVFASYFSHGVFSQPFHIRGDFAREQLLPFRQLEIRNVRFNAPADIENWLVLNYDAKWRTPQPGFQLHTPQATSRRFNSQFGSFNQHRHFWELLAAEEPAALNYERLLPDVTTAELNSGVVVNLGCGNSVRLPSTVQHRPDARVVGIDFADGARKLAGEGRDDEREAALSSLSFANYNAILRFVSDLPVGSFDVYAGFVAEGQDPRRRKAGFWPLLRMSLKSGGSVVVDFLSTLGVDYTFDDPRSWHLEFRDFENEARQFGLTARLLGSGTARVAGHERPFLRVTLSSLLNEDPSSSRKDELMSEKPHAGLTARFKRLVRQLQSRVSLGGRSRELRREVAQLREEIDEVREDQRRVAELMDAVETIAVSISTSQERDRGLTARD